MLPLEVNSFIFIKTRTFDPSLMFLFFRPILANKQIHAQIQQYMD